MTAIKTIVATGATSNLGFEAVKLLLKEQTPYRLILGCRDTQRTKSAYDALSYDARHSLTYLPLELSDLPNVQRFAQQTLRELGSSTTIDYLFLNAGMIKAATEPGVNGARWCESLIVNHFSQHYLTHLLRGKLTPGTGRVVIVSSGAVRMVKDPRTLAETLKANSGADFMPVYAGSKLVQLVGAHYWRKQLGDKAHVVAVSPGMIPGTGLGRHTGMSMPTDSPDAKSVETGAASLVAAFKVNEWPSDPQQVFLTSWGEWWAPKEIEQSLDPALQEQWCPSQAEMEREYGLQREAS